MRERRTLARVAAFACAVACGTPPLAAQDLPGIGAADTTAANSTAPSPGWRRVTPLGDLRLRGDSVREAPIDDFDRARAFLRLGAAVRPVPSLELGGAFEAAVGSDSNVDNRIHNDNETSDDFNLDLAYARWQPRDNLMLAGGRRPLPLQFTALAWDEDLRPVGMALVVRRPWRAYDAWRFGAGVFGVRSLADSWVRLAAAQATYAWRDGGPRGADARLGFLGFGRDDALVADRLARTNVVRQGRFAASFELLDLQVDARLAPAGWPCVLQAEWVENLGADEAAAAWRAGVRLGDRRAPGHVELLYLFHRIERDAVLAAFNSDDWWFHSAMRGHRVGVAVGAGHGVALGVSGSIERRDDLDAWTKRLLVDAHVDFAP